MCVDVGTTDIREIKSSTNEDGVYRGGPGRDRPVRPGGMASRKQLTRIDG